jgi:hypothetical protein
MLKWTAYVFKAPTFDIVNNIIYLCFPFVGTTVGNYIYICIYLYISTDKWVALRTKLCFSLNNKTKLDQNKKKLDPTIKIYHLKNKELMISKLSFDILLDQFTKCRASKEIFKIRTKCKASNRSLKYEVQT